MAESNGAVATAERTQAAAKGVSTEGARSDDEVAIGTPAPDVSVHPDESPASATPEGDTEAPPGDGGDTAEEFIYSEATYKAGREEADLAGYDRGRKEHADSQSTRRAELLRLANTQGASTALILRETEAAAKALELTPEEADSVVKPSREALGVYADIAIALADQDYRDTIDGLLETDDERKAFWADSRSTTTRGVLGLIVETLAPKSRWLAAADPDDLIKANAKLRTHISATNDAAKREGRGIGQKDRNGDRSGAGGTNNGASAGTWKTKAEAQNLFVAGKLPGGAAKMREIRDDPSIPWGF